MILFTFFLTLYMVFNFNTLYFYYSPKGHVYSPFEFFYFIEY